MGRYLIAFVGVLLLWGCSGERTAPEAVLTTAERLALPPDTETGRRLFLTCAVCHERTQGTGHRVGPNLWGVYGRDAAHYNDFSYSPALRDAGLVWTAEVLDGYLANPKKYLPGGRMAYPGEGNAANRRDLIAFLETLQ